MNPLLDENPMKLGVFATNGRGGATQTVLPEAPRTTWDVSVRTAVAADRAGFECVVPYARWKGYVAGRPDHPSGVVLDPFTWAAGVSALTERIAVLSTSHAPTVHPLVAAKQGATIDEISGGRFALNVVGGWNRPELEMFGASMREHDERYDHLAEWLEVLQRLWTESEEFDHHGRFFDVLGGMSRPRPRQHHIPIMNAGGSPRGRRFAAEHADLCFVGVSSETTAEIREQVDGYKSLAREEFGREVQVWTPTVVVQRNTRSEAEAYLERYSVEYEDTASVDAWTALMGANTQGRSPETMARMRQRFAAGSGGFLLVGTAEDIRGRLELLHEGGVDGVLLTWVDYDDGLARFTDDVLPRLETAGLRAPVPALSSPSGRP